MRVIFFWNSRDKCLQGIVKEGKEGSGPFSLHFFLLLSSLFFIYSFFLLADTLWPISSKKGGLHMPSLALVVSYSHLWRKQTSHKSLSCLGCILSGTSSQHFGPGCFSPLFHAFEWLSYWISYCSLLVMDNTDNWINIFE